MNAETDHFPPDLLERAIAQLNPRPADESRIPAALEATRRTLAQAIEADRHLDYQQEHRRRGWDRLGIVSRSRIAAAAAIVIVILGGLAILDPWKGPPAPNGAWSLGPPAAWAREALAAIENVKGVTCREQTIWVTTDGSRHVSSTVTTFYISEDSYRRDIYDAGQLREIQWYTPDGDGTVQTSVRFDLDSYWVERHERGFGHQDPVERMRYLIGMLHRADRGLGTEWIEDRECRGFELQASRYGDNPDTWIDRIWFDVESRLPVRIERERPASGEGTTTGIRVQDRFVWDPQLAAETFAPVVPEGFIKAHPDDLQSPEE
ncbi:MAG: hypothetical protein GY778_23640 [bacterium]|nr:hypothetical protein [bacterium]